jgi:Enoyl-(Acyl carrier protein) reductase
LTFVLNGRARKTAAGLSMDIGGAGFLLLSIDASIILNASIVASKGFSSNSVYSATKAAVRSFARTWTTDLKDRHIRVNAVSPGPIETGRASNACRCLPTALRSAGSVHLMRSPRPWCFSHPTTAATSRERNYLSMAASHKCRLLIAEGHGINNCSSQPSTRLWRGIDMTEAKARRIVLAGRRLVAQSRENTKAPPQILRRGRAFFSFSGWVSCLLGLQPTS